MFYAKSTGGFYDPDINTVIPADAVEITADQHAALLAAQSAGSIIQANANGLPVAVAPPAPTSAQIVAAYEAAGQAALDAQAQAWGYDSVVSAASYAASSVTQYAADAKALIAWRDAFWQAAFAIEAAVKAGTATMPATPAAFVALLPAPPARP